MPPVGGALEVVLLSKMGCRLCEAVEAEIRSMPAGKITLTVVNIDEDPVLHDMYWLRVPLVRVGGRDVFGVEMMDVQGEWKEKLVGVLR